jgi:hypothetical protein
MSTLLGLLSSLAAMIRWGEPWDVEVDEDPLLDRSYED